jgi:hypothetical protein
MSFAGVILKAPESRRFEIAEIFPKPCAVSFSAPFQVVRPFPLVSPKSKSDAFYSAVKAGL